MDGTDPAPGHRAQGTGIRCCTAADPGAGAGSLNEGPENSGEGVGDLGGQRAGGPRTPGSAGPENRHQVLPACRSRVRAEHPNEGQGKGAGRGTGTPGTAPLFKPVQMRGSRTQGRGAGGQGLGTRDRGLGGGAGDPGPLDQHPLTRWG